MYRVIEGNQRFATPKYAFWGIDVKLVIKKQKTRKETLPFPHYLPKGTQTEKPAYRKGASAQLHNIKCVRRGEIQPSLFVDLPSGSHCFWVAQQGFAGHGACSLLSAHELPAFPWESRPLPASPWSRMIYRSLNCPTRLGVSVLGHPCMDTVISMDMFSC